MKILFVSELEDKVSSGMSWSVPARIAAQSQIDEVLWVNLSDATMLHWKETKVFYKLSGYRCLRMKNMPDGFEHPDLVVFEGVYYIKFVILAKELRKVGIPYVIVPRSMLTYDAIHNGKFFKKKVANILFFKKFVRKALAIQYLTKKEYYDSGADWNKNYIISPNGFDTPTSIKRVVKKKGINCTFIGRIDIYQKGLDLLVKSCSEIQESLRQSQFSITLYGPGEHGSVNILTKQIKKYGLSDIIKLGGEIRGEAKTCCLLSSDLFIMTSRFEGMPMGLIEALAYQVPALITSGTNMCDQIESHNAGWTCGENVEDIRNGLLQVIEEQQLLEQKGENARELALLYNWNKIAQQFNEDVLFLMHQRK